jgi:spermidine synthase
MTPRRVFLLLYSLSGFAALLYEVSWSRLLALHLGHTLAAVSTVLAAFMGGLAAGAALAGARAPRLSEREAVRAYARLEIAIGATALVVPVVLAAAHPLLAAAYADGNGTWFGSTRVVVAVAALALPTLAMGATFPIAVRALGSGVRDTGALYAANTLGAAVGAALTGFALLPALGLRLTTLVGVAVNVVVAIGAWRLSESVPHRSAHHKPPRRESPTRWRTASAVRTPAIAAIGLSGFIALAYEVAWTRVLALVIGPTSYAFSGMLVTFIAGLAIGSALAARMAPRLARPLLALALTLLVAAAGATAAVAWIERGPLVVGRWVASDDVRFGRIVAAGLGFTALLLLPITIALGAAFPFAIAAAAREGRREGSASAAAVYVANTIGAIAGAFVAGWALVPALGLRTTIVGLAIVGAAAALLLAAATAGARIHTIATGAVAAAVAIVALTLPSWDIEVLSGGAYKYAPYLRGVDLEVGLAAGTLLYYDEGASGVVTVRRTAGSTALAIDGKVDASNTSDMLTQRLLAHVPLLVHPAPRRVAIVGLGSGVTAGSALTHPVEQVDVVEISPEVIEASSFFSSESHDALRDSRLRLIVGDGRSHLLLGSATYDVIVSEPSNPWMAGVAGLFTRELFGAARARLAPGGVFCQWAHTYDISGEDLRSIVATFAAVFPEGTMWLVGEGDLLLVGGLTPLAPDRARIEAARALPLVQADLEDVGVRSAFGLLSLFVGSGDTLKTYAADAAVQTDDRLALEFSDANARALRTLAQNAPKPDAVARARASATAADWRDRGIMLLRARAHQAAFDDLRRAMEMAPRDRETLAAFARAASAAERLEEADADLAALAARDPANVPARLERSRLAASKGDGALARALVGEAARSAPSDPAVVEQLASIVADEQDAEGLAAAVGELRRLAPKAGTTLYYAATLEYLRGNADAAAKLAERAARSGADDARVRNLLGAAYAATGRNDGAREAFRAAVRASPEDPVGYVNLGTLELGSANAVAAGDYFSDALALDPQSTAAREGLARALEAQGLARRAAAIRQGT